MRSPGPFLNDTDNLVGELPYIKQLKNKQFSAKRVSLLRAGALLYSSLNPFVCRCSENACGCMNGWENRCSVPDVKELYLVYLSF